MKRFLRGLGSLAVMVAVFFVLLEAGCFVAIKAGWFPVEMPGYKLSGSGWFWRDVNPDFGVWHLPNNAMVHHRQCFNVTYRSNSFGMRDAETAKTGEEHRVVVLGDSFVEGWGVERGKRFTDLIEQDNGVELLNFGTAGGFGSTQSYILYKTFASGFSHDAVVFAVLPDNDFGDDTPPGDKIGPGGRWKPYLVGSYPHYVLTYPDREFQPDHRVDRAIEVIMEEFWITYRVGVYYQEILEDLYRGWRNPGGDDGHTRSRYYDYSEEQFDRLRHAIEQIKALAGSRPMLVVTIPRPADFKRTGETGGEPPIRRDLAALAADLGITYVDLMIGMGGAEDLDSYFHTCDGHWSPKGHARAAEIIGAWDYFDGKPESVAGRAATPDM